MGDGNAMVKFCLGHIHLQECVEELSLNEKCGQLRAILSLMFFSRTRVANHVREQTITVRAFLGGSLLLVWCVQ